MLKNIEAIEGGDGWWFLMVLTPDREPGGT
jgi:hypothetical protein